jgi:prepilin-type N-terminal cleavage/methylation domain-containing protein
MQAQAQRRTTARAEGALIGLRSIDAPLPTPGRGVDGFTLVEVLVAMTIIVVALLGVGGTLALQSGGLAAAVPVGQAAVTRGHYLSSATFLAQERLEQLRRLEFRLGPPAVDRIGSGAPPAELPDEDFGVIPGFRPFRREVSVQDGVPGDGMKTVSVTVKFMLPRESGVARESVTLATIVAARP